VKLKRLIESEHEISCQIKNPDGPAAAEDKFKRGCWKHTKCYKNAEKKKQGDTINLDIAEHKAAEVSAVWRMNMDDIFQTILVTILAGGIQRRAEVLVARRTEVAEGTSACWTEEVTYA